MAVWARVKSLDLRQLITLSKAFALQPGFIMPTYKATKETLEICDLNFGKHHHGDNITNAFRHALWNYQICKRCLSTSGSVEKAVKWSEKITGLHEKLFQNDLLSETMDLHNNRVGREVFQANCSAKFEAVNYFMKKMAVAIKVSSLEEIELAQENLVYIEKLKPNDEDQIL